MCLVFRVNGVAQHMAIFFFFLRNDLVQISESIDISLRENRQSVGQNRQISEMSGEFCQFAGQ